MWAVDKNCDTYKANQLQKNMEIGQKKLTALNANGIQEKESSVQMMHSENGIWRRMHEVQSPVGGLHHW